MNCGYNGHNMLIIRTL